MVVPEREQREKGPESLHKGIMANKLLDLQKKMNIQIQETQKTPYKMD